MFQLLRSSRCFHFAPQHGNWKNSAANVSFMVRAFAQCLSTDHIFLAAVEALVAVTFTEKSFNQPLSTRSRATSRPKWMFVSGRPKMGGMMAISAAMSVKTPLPPCHASITPHCAVTPPPPITSSADLPYMSRQSITAGVGRRTEP